MGDELDEDIVNKCFVMEQKSNVQSRAEKEYKNRREIFPLLLSIVIS
jgi:hypothetical protein